MRFDEEHPLDDEEIMVIVVHVPTRSTGTAMDDKGTPVGETIGRALDDLLSQLEQRGGG